VNRLTQCEGEPEKIMARLAKTWLVDGNFYNFFRA
jgi:hypothetical protein